MELETLETERLLLKKLTPENLEHLFAHHSETEICALMGLGSHAEFLKEKEKVDGGYRTYDRTIVSFLLIEKGSGKTIGRSGFHNWYAAHYRAELGYHIYSQSDWNKGYMSEAVAAILAYGFKTMQLNRVEAFVGPGNAASLRIVEKHGFVQEGHLKQHYVREKPEDSLVFGLLRENYMKTP